MWLKKKGEGSMWGFMQPLAIGLGAAVILIIGYLILSGKISSGIDYIKNLLRFG